MADVAGGQSEYYLGYPLGRMVLLTDASIATLPQFAGGAIYYSVAATQTNGGHNLFKSVRPGGCPRNLADVVVQSADPNGRGFVAYDAGHLSLIDGNGHRVTRLTSGYYSWSNDGVLVGSDGRGTITAFDHSGQAKRTAQLAGYPLGAFGKSGVMVSGTTGSISVFDADSGRLSTISVAANQSISGSPDGQKVAAIDITAGVRVTHPSSGTSRAVAVPGPVLRLLWSRDSVWLAVQTQFGGILYRDSDGKTVDLGALNVISWG